MCRIHRLAIVLGFLAALTLGAEAVSAASAAEIDRDARAALDHLVATHPAAKALAKEARAVLVFPSILKGGFMVGGQVGDGALLRDGKATEYYRSVAASYGLQAGIQKFGYALFFMDQSALSYLEKSEGWEIGVGPSVVVVDAGVAQNITTTTARKDVYAFFFDQKGLMAGLGIQGTKITRIHPD
jgi:lipid-binding SYLF domain-containing protein